MDDIPTYEIDAAARQEIYKGLDEDTRRVILAIKDDRPFHKMSKPLISILDDLVEKGLVTGKGVNLTPRGVQIAAGVAKRWPEGKDI